MKILIIPIFWTLLGIASVFASHAFEKAKIPRAFRRAHRKLSRPRKISKRIFKYPKQYRKHLRDSGLCFTRAPTEHERHTTTHAVRAFNRSVNVRRTAETPWKTSKRKNVIQ